LAKVRHGLMLLLSTARLRSSLNHKLSLRVHSEVFALVSLLDSVSMVLPRFGTTPLAAIKQRDVQAWVADLRARGFAPATVVKAYQLLGRT
jgi:hypothetical protein